LHAEHICRDRTFGEYDQFGPAFSGFIGKLFDAWPTGVEIKSIVCSDLHYGDGYLSVHHEMLLPNDGSTLHPEGFIT
jgi:hypothetical protein